MCINVHIATRYNMHFPLKTFFDQLLRLKELLHWLLMRKYVLQKKAKIKATY